MNRFKGGEYMTDSQLRVKMKKSPAEGRRALFDEYCAYVYAIAAQKLRTCASREDIEECVSDVFADVYRVCGEDSGYEGDLKGLIGIIARRKAVDYFRRLSAHSGRTISSDSEDFPEVSSPENVEKSSEQAELRRILTDCIKRLGEPDSVIITQQYYYGRTVREIAAVLKMSEAAVQKRSTRARAKLKTLLAENGIEEV